MTKFFWLGAPLGGKAGVAAVRMALSDPASGVDWSSRKPAMGRARLCSVAAAEAGTAPGYPTGFPEASRAAAAPILAEMVAELSPLHGDTVSRTAAPPQNAALVDWNAVELK